MAETPLTDEEIVRLRRDFAAADAARNTLLNKAGGIIAAYAPSVATYLAAMAAGAGAGWVMKPVPVVESPAPIVQPAKVEPVKVDSPKVELKADPWRSK